MIVTHSVLEVTEPHFTIKFYSNFLKINLKGSGFKNEIEEALENNRSQRTNW